MITSSDIADILYRDCGALGLPVERFGNTTTQHQITSERVVIHAKELDSQQGTWCKCFVEVNILVPDDTNGKAAITRLGELERMARKHLHQVGTYDGTVYSYNVASTTILQEEKHQAHYVNTRVLFRVLNVKE